MSITGYGFSVHLILSPTPLPIISEYLISAHSSQLSCLQGAIVELCSISLTEEQK